MTNHFHACTDTLICSNRIVCGDEIRNPIQSEKHSYSPFFPVFEDIPLGETPIEPRPAKLGARFLMIPQPKKEIKYLNETVNLILYDMLKFVRIRILQTQPSSSLAP